MAQKNETRYDPAGQHQTRAAGLQDARDENRDASKRGCPQSNTLIDFLYRDAGNYKVRSTAIVSGAITDTDIDVIMSCLYEGEWFIPEMVGLDGERFSTFDPTQDHPWFELYRDSFTITTRPCTTHLDVSTLVAAFQAAYAQNWQQL